MKRYYPTEERSFAKRLLVVLLAIVCFQIYSAEEDLALAVASSAAAEGLPAASAREARCEPLVPLDQPGSREMQGAANATGRPSWENHEIAISTIIDITQFLLQARTAF